MKTTSDAQWIGHELDTASGYVAELVAQRDRYKALIGAHNAWIVNECPIGRCSNDDGIRMCKCPRRYMIDLDEGK